MKPKHRPATWRPLRLLGIFLAGSKLRQAAVLLALLLAGSADALSIATLLPALSLLEGGSGPEGSLAQKLVVDLFEGLGLPLSLPWLLAIFLGGLFVKALAVMLAMYYAGTSAARLATQLRTRLIAALLQAKWGYFSRIPAAHLSTAVSSEATRASAAYLDIASTLANGLQVIVYLALCLVVSWKLSVLALAVGLLMMLSLGRLVKIARRAGNRQTLSTRRLVGLLNDILASAKPLKAMARQNNLGDLYHAEAGRLHRALTRQVLSRYALRSLQEPVIGLFLAAGLLIGQGYAQVALPELIVMALLLIRTARMAGRAQQAYQLASTAESAYWFLQSEIAGAETARETETGGVIQGFHRSCRFDEVHFAHGEQPVLKGGTLEIPKGQVTVVTGPSGGGKSTLTDLLLGLYQPTRGRILINGEPLDRLDLRQWRRGLGYVPQEIVLFNGSVRDNVTFGDPSISASAVEAALDAVGLKLPTGQETQVGEHGNKLSGGQRQRIALARALVREPALLILDEATSGLDAESEAEICAVVRRLAEHRALTVLAIAHRPAWLSIADRVYRLDDGRIRPLQPKKQLATAIPTGVATLTA